jgi:ferredoxin-NADP reductase
MEIAVVLENTPLTNDVFELTLNPTSTISFFAGQFINIKIADSESPCFRAYSIASSPADAQNIKLCIKVVDGGRGSNWLKKLKIGDTIDFVGPVGNFLLHSSQDREVFFVATGTGIAPFKSMIEDQLLAKQNSNQKMTLLFGLRQMKDIFYEDEFKNLANKHKNFEFQLALSQPEDSTYDGKTGRVTNFLEEIPFDPNKSDFYICGVKNMIESVKDLLLNKGVDEKSIYFEEY